MLDEWTRTLGSHSISGVPLDFIVWFGICGCLLDADHPIAFYWITNLSQRFLHTPALILSGVIFCVGIACAGRFLYQNFLIK